jgi:hypothetical protein
MLVKMGSSMRNPLGVGLSGKRGFQPVRAVSPFGAIGLRDKKASDGRSGSLLGVSTTTRTTLGGCARKAEPWSDCSYQFRCCSGQKIKARTSMLSRAGALGALVGSSNAV